MLSHTLKAESLNVEHIDIYIYKDKRQRVQSIDLKNGLNVKELFISLKCANNLKRNEFTLKLSDNQSYFVLFNKFSTDVSIAEGDDILIVTSSSPFVNENCTNESTLNTTTLFTKTKNLDLESPIILTEIYTTKITTGFTSSSTLANIVSKFHVNFTLISSILVGVIVLLVIGLFLVFLLFKTKAKKDDRLGFVDSTANLTCKTEKKELFSDWKNKLMHTGCNSMNTIDTRASMVSNGGDFLTIRSKHSINDEFFYNDIEELKVNDKSDVELRKQVHAQVSDGLFAFSDGYLNEMGINMMDNLRNIAINSKLAENTEVNDPESESKYETNNFSSNTFASTSFNKQGCLEATLNNDKFEYMDVGFYKWCKLLDWKLEFSDLSNVLDDLIQLD